MRRPTGSPTCRPRALGNAWLARGETARCCVPSAAGGLQYLLNAEHPQLAQCQIVSALAYPYLPHLTGWTAPCWMAPAGWSRPGRRVAGAGLSGRRRLAAIPYPFPEELAA